MKNKPIIIVGGIPYPNRPSTIGGTTVLLRNFLDYCKDNSIPHIIVSTNKHDGKLAFLRNYFSMVANILANISKAQTIMVNISSLKGTYLIFPLILLIAKIFRKKIAFRMFAGNLKYYLSNRTTIRKFIIFCLKRTDIAFFETKELIEYFSAFKIKTAWFPNARKREADKKSDEEINNYQNRFAFMAHVKKEKGIDELIAAFKKLPKKYSVDLYGTVVGYDIKYLQGENYHYKGLLQPSDVFKTLRDYDALILPTHWQGEGYPGIIIEAFSIGVPCISTYWGGIPEIVANGQNGFLIQPGDIDALVAAVKNFDNADHLRFAHNAIRSFEDNFDSDCVNSRIINTLNAL